MLNKTTYLAVGSESHVSSDNSTRVTSVDAVEKRYYVSDNLGPDVEFAGRLLYDVRKKDTAFAYPVIQVYAFTDADSKERYLLVRKYEDECYLSVVPNFDDADEFLGYDKLAKALYHHLGMLPALDLNQLAYAEMGSQEEKEIRDARLRALSRLN